MSEFGSRLKQARESRGISLRQIATATKISPVALESLERGDLSKLPGGIFSKAFVRAYATEVGLNSDELVEQFLVELGEYERSRNTDEKRPEVTADDRAFLEQQRRAAIGLRIALVVLVLLVIATVMAWQMRRGDASTAIERTEPEIATVPAAPMVVALWVELTATDHCWVQVTADGTRRPALVMASGTRERFDAEREIVLEVGSAGAVSMLVNGRQARALGKAGEVRTVTISVANVAEFYQDQAARPTPTASVTGHP
jgi:cytoskeleton protein RodZ